MRRFLAVLLIALALATAVVYARAVMSPLTLSIGSGSAALAQNGATVVTTSSHFGIALSLAAPSTAGTSLIAILGDAGGYTVVTMPASWVKVGSVQLGGGGNLELWAFFNNPGGISVVNATVSNDDTLWRGHISEWSNLSSVVDASGTATAVAGTTLTPATTAAVTTIGDLAISAWLQYTGLNNAATFTTPAGFTRLRDDGATVALAHLDIEYQINPPPGLLSPTLTSDRTTAGAEGFTFVLKAAHPAVDQTAYLAY